MRFVTGALTEVVYAVIGFGVLFVISALVVVLAKRRQR